MIRLAVRVRRDQAELVLAELLALAPAGVEEVDAGPELVEYAIYAAPGELADLGEVRAAAGGALVEVFTRELADDWAERWKAFHRPVTVTGPTGRVGVHVRPPWAPPPPRGPLDVVIDPGQAFGTGAHASTRLCLELLLGLAEEDGAGGALSDVGCGSGVLAIAAAKLGWTPVVAMDFDQASLRATRQNAAVNGVRLDVRAGDLRHRRPPDTPALVANLLAPLLVQMSGYPPPPRLTVLIAGGLLVSEADEVAGTLAGHWGLRECRRVTDGDWAALALGRPPA